MHVFMYLSLIVHSSFSLYPSVNSSFLSSRHEIVSYLLFFHTAAQSAVICL